MENFNPSVLIAQPRGDAPYSSVSGSRTTSFSNCLNDGVIGLLRGKSLFPQGLPKLRKDNLRLWLGTSDFGQHPRQ